jgi:ferredoxin
MTEATGFEAKTIHRLLEVDPKAGGFKRNDDGGHSFLYKQPENPDEEKLCKEAMEGCPVEAIGSDGE